MYALVRRYEGVDPSDIDQIVRQVDAGFVPILEQTRGFQGYWAIRAEDGEVAVARSPKPAGTPVPLG